MENMNLLEVSTPIYIYNGCSTYNTLWEEKFTHMNMQMCGLSNVRKHREIKNGEQYVLLDISLKFGNLDDMETTSSEPKYDLEISGKGLITSLGLKEIRT